MRLEKKEAWKLVLVETFFYATCFQKYAVNSSSSLNHAKRDFDKYLTVGLEAKRKNFVFGFFDFKIGISVIIY